MNPINPWLDPIEVRRLAENLMRPVHEPAAINKDAGFDEAFVGYASARPLAPDSPASPVLQTAAPASVQAEPPPASPAEPDSLNARGPFLERIQRFRDWMQDHFAASGLFILDREGEVIFDENNHGRLHFLARSLALASRRQGASTGNVHVKIGAGATLEVIPVDTAYGCLVLGAVVPEPLQAAAITAVTKALSRIATPPGGS
jgi:hypothetical protein